MSSVAHAVLKGLILAAVLAFGAGPAAAEVTAVVRVERLNLRAGPGVTHPVVTQLAHGTRVTVIGPAGDWLHVRHGDNTGYLRHLPRFVRLDETPAGDVAAPATVAAGADVNDRIAAHQREARRLARNEEALLDTLDQIDLDLFKTRRRLKALTAELAHVTEIGAQTEDEARRLATEFARLRDQAARRLVALYKLGWLGELEILASADSMYELLQRQVLLGRVLAADRRLLQRLEDRRARLDASEKKLRDTRAAALALADEMADQVRHLETQRAERARLLADLRSRRSAELAAAAALRRAAQRLTRTLAALPRATETPPPDEPAAPDEPPAAAPSRPATAVEPASDAAPQSFAALKGLLPMPVSGNIISFFTSRGSAAANPRTMSNGIDIRAERGEPIRAVGRGRVVFSDWFKGYGNLLIIDHGGSYYTLYAHLEDRFKEKRDAVDPGEVIATVGESGSLDGPKLHFEVRHHDRPVDPLDWLDGNRG